MSRSITIDSLMGNHQAGFMDVFPSSNFCRFFSRMKQLEYVNFSSNSLSSFPPIMGSPRLRCILLHSNELTSLPAMPTLPQLHTLDLACNQFEAVPDLSRFPRLQFLDLSGNTKLSISKNSIKTLKYAVLLHDIYRPLSLYYTSCVLKK